MFSNIQSLRSARGWWQVPDMIVFISVINTWLLPNRRENSSTSSRTPPPALPWML